MNRLCNSFVPNTSEKSKFFGFEIRTIREEESLEGGTYMRTIKTITDFNDDQNAIGYEVFYRIYGLYFYTQDDNLKYRQLKETHIKDFFKIEHAQKFLSDLTGDHVHIYSY
tara:strand:+ start:237 stop:569 length:333 start_codon:yes stop_codon:yes gene_type:complete